MDELLGCVITIDRLNHCLKEKIHLKEGSSPTLTLEPFLTTKNLIRKKRTSQRFLLSWSYSVSSLPRETGPSEHIFNSRPWGLDGPDSPRVDTLDSRNVRGCSIHNKDTKSKKNLTLSILYGWFTNLVSDRVPFLMYSHTITMRKV